ncbi:MAG: transporter, family, cyanate transporter [Pseudonocardiales bacterium]|nr:transporter, family, cyanate transporter [Pseudonocardiales bacterium]
MARQQQFLKAAPASAQRSQVWLLVAALVLTGLSMRTAVTSTGAVLDDLQADLHAGSGVAGLITTLPVICFAALGWVTPRLSHRYGAQRLLVAALVLMTLGLVLRAVVSSVWTFLLLSVLALSGGAISNVLMPSLVKRHFPDQVGRMTAVYTTALAIGMTASAGLTVPIGRLGHNWRLGLGVWALLSALAVLPWLPTLRRDRPDPDVERGISASRLVHSRTAWLLMTFFAFQSFQAYVAFGWFAKFLHAHGVSSDRAGWMVAVVAAVSIPVSMVVPSVAPHRHRLVIVVISGCYLIAYVGLAVAPVGGAWVWMALDGVGSAMFPLALTMIGLRARSAETTAALSAFVQAIGYVVAGTGPLLFGVLYGATGGWTLSLALLFVALAIAFVSGWLASRPAYVDDELAEFAT